MQTIFDGKRWNLCIDQYGRQIYARTVKELKEKAGPGKVFKIYVDRLGKSIHVGYGVGESWFSIWKPI